MPRIRTIKPEFWDSPGTARATLRARLFFIAMWNWADDYGVGTANPKQLIGFAFPNDDDVTVADFPRLRTEVAECFDVAFYEVDGRPYFAIPSWDRHQKNERRANAKNPGPDKGNRIDTEMCGDSVTSNGSSGTGTGEQGNRGTGEELPSAPPARVSKADLKFVEFWDAYPLKKGKEGARRVWDRLVKKHDPALIIAGAKAYAEEVRDIDDRRKIKYPQGWLNDGRWMDEPDAEPEVEERKLFTPPAPPADMPRELYVAWCRTHAEANKAGRAGPADWRELREAS